MPRLVARPRFLLPLLLALAACGRQVEPPRGSYRAEIAAQAGPLPFILEVGQEGGKPVATVVNGANRVRAEATRIDGDTLTLDFPSYESSLEARVAPGGGLVGTAHLYRRTGRLDLPLTATAGAAPRFFAQPQPAAAPYSGSWPIQQLGKDGERGVLLLTQSGSALSGSIQFPSGDERFLVGEASGNNFALSTFDGNQGSVWRGSVQADGTLAGESYGLASVAPDKWVSRKRETAPAPDFAAIEEEKPPVDRIAFSFPDADGKPVSLADPRYRGKVVVVTIGGTWCPNCHDEIAFLAPYAKRRQAEGLEVIGLSFEYGGDPVRASRQIKRFAQRYQVGFPILFAGKATPADTMRALPGLGGVKVYPTTLFIDRAGTLRAVHVGYAGPATGALNAKAEAAFDALVSKLLAEKG